MTTARIKKMLPGLLLVGLAGSVAVTTIGKRDINQEVLAQQISQSESVTSVTSNVAGCEQLYQSNGVPFPCVETEVSNEQLERNRAAVHQFFVKVWETGDLTLIDATIEPNAKDYSPLGKGEGTNSFKGIISSFHSALEDVTAKGTEVAQGDLVTHFWEISGQHTAGVLMGVPPTHKEIHLSGATTVRIKDGKFIERWTQLDMLGLLQQLGVIPAQGGAPQSPEGNNSAQ